MTPYQDINKILSSMANSIQDILGKNLVGLYLFGSLSYGDFNPNSSDIDLTNYKVRL
jgi:predicted nucleotidyltransferase